METATPDTNHSNTLTVQDSRRVIVRCVAEETLVVGQAVDFRPFPFTIPVRIGYLQLSRQYSLEQAVIVDEDLSGVGEDGPGQEILHLNVPNTELLIPGCANNFMVRMKVLS